MTYDPTLYLYKSVFLQRIADYVRSGHVHWTSGEVTLSKAAALAKKFDRLYGVGRTRHQRAWARQKGEASAVLLFYRRPERTSDSPVLSPDGKQQTADEVCQTTERPEPTLMWMLLVTDGEHLAPRLERLRLALDPGGRVRFDELELVALPRAGQAKPAWTWRLTEDAVQGWRASLIDCARRQPWRLGHEVQQLARLPGFAGCRAQVKKLMQLARGEHRRRLPDAPALACPRHPYLARLPDAGVRLSALVRVATSVARRSRPSCAANTGVRAACH